MKPKPHADRVLDSLNGLADLPASDPLSASWRRSAQSYGIDPASAVGPCILSNPEITSAQQKLDGLAAASSFEIDRLFNVVRAARYTVLLCNDEGIVVDSRSDPAETKQLTKWGLWRGGVWSEAAEGTNGVGTCIAEQRAVTVHRGQHFRARHSVLSCSSAPIFDPTGKLVAVLDVSCGHPDLSEQSLALTGAITAASARSIEEKLFRTNFNRDWIIVVVLPDAGGSTLLLATNSHQEIVGYDRAALLLLARDGCVIGKSLWELFEKDPILFRNKHSDDLHGRLKRLDTGECWPVFVTPPQRPSGSRWETKCADLRMTTLAAGSLAQPPARGGLPPGVLRRVQEHIEVHLEHYISVETLAATAGLSTHHFARAFKHSTGITPHRYLLQQRVERAKGMLLETSLSLSEVALATGFSDQSHFARQFRQLSGMPPNEFRWKHR